MIGYVLFYIPSAVCLGKSVCQNMWNKAQPETLHFGTDFNVNQAQNPQLYQTTPPGNVKINGNQFTRFRGDIICFVAFSLIYISSLR